MVFDAIKNYLSISQCVVLELVPLQGKNIFTTRPQNRILVPFRGSFQNFRRVTDHFYTGVPPSPIF